MSLNSGTFTDSPIANEKLRIYLLKRNFGMLEANYCDLMNRLVLLDDPASSKSIWNGNVDDLDNLIFDVSRLLINFVSLALALVDVNRKQIRKWYKGTDFLDVYQQEINTRIINNDHIAFIQELRNYALHFSLPIVNAKGPTYIASNISYVCGFVLKKSKLLEANLWKKSRFFLNGQDESIDVKIIIENYFQTVKGFYTWLFTTMEKRVIDLYCS